MFNKSINFTIVAKCTKHIKIWVLLHFWKINGYGAPVIVQYKYASRAYVTYLVANSAAKTAQTENYFAELEPGYFISKNMPNTVETSTGYLYNGMCHIFCIKYTGYSSANHVFILFNFCCAIGSFF